VPVLLSAIPVPANRNDECVLHLVLIQQRRDTDDARSNSRADWPELLIFAQNAPPGESLSIATIRVCTMTLHGISLHGHCATLLVWTHHKAQKSVYWPVHYLLAPRGYLRREATGISRLRALRGYWRRGATGDERLLVNAGLLAPRGYGRRGSTGASRLLPRLCEPMCLWNCQQMKRVI